MEFNYCRRCGTGLKQIAPTAYKCAKGHSIFSNPVPTVGVFILTDDDKVMLAVRGIEPHKGMLDTFGGFLDGPETIEEALAREMNEELGLSPEQYEPAVSLGSGKGRYPFEGEPYPVVTSYFYTHLVGNANPVPADDVADIRIVDLDNLDMSELHDDDVRTGVMLLKQALAKEYVA